MKSFSLFIGKLILVFIGCMILLDLFYTLILTRSKYRNKVEYIVNAEPQELDLIILGTSRANNHFVSDVFEKKGIKTFNFGISGSHLFETSLLLKLLIANGWKIKNVIIETDLNLSNEKRDDGTFSQFMPFLHQSNIIQKHFENEHDYFLLYYIPFYRYIKFDEKIGLRNVYKTLINETTNALHNKGYYPLGFNPKAKMKHDITALKLIENSYYEEIKQVCKKNNINLIAVTTPMCSNVAGMEYFKKVKVLYPEIKEYEHLISNDSYFSSCGHLNHKGAKRFTELILKNLIINK